MGLGRWVAVCMCECVEYLRWGLGSSRRPKRVGPPGTVFPRFPRGIQLGKEGSKRKSEQGSWEGLTKGVKGVLGSGTCEKVLVEEGVI